MGKLGAHLSIAGGYQNPLEKIVKIGGNCLQIFSTSPRSWNKAQLNNSAIQQFKKLRTKLKIDPVYFHSSYLINLANHTSGGHLSKESLIHELHIAKLLGIKGSIVHLGSFKNENEVPKEQFDALIKNIQEVLEKTPKETLLVIENAGTRKIGRDLNQIATIIRLVNSSRLRVCLDTCHLHTAGYDLSSLNKINDFLNEFDKKIGLERLELWHMNDSRDQFGSLRDRHDNIGAGTIRLSTFQGILNHPKLQTCSFIIETPGFDKLGPDKKNLDILKSLLK